MSNHHSFTPSARFGGVFLFLALLSLLGAFACEPSEENALPIEAIDGDASDSWEQEAEESASEQEREVLGDAPEDEETPEQEDETNEREIEEEQTKPALFHTDADQGLFAAFSKRVVTPDETNHPCTVYMAGTAWNRIPEGVHDDIELRGVALAEAGEYALLFSIDAIGMMLPDIERIQTRLAQSGIDPSRVILSATHSHSAPDTVGLWGSYLDSTGRCEAYIDYLAETVHEMALEMSLRLLPAIAYANETIVDEPAASHPRLVDDFRLPFVTNDHLTGVLIKEKSSLETLGTIVNWHNHPETTMGLGELSADFPHYLRNRMEGEFGGGVIYVTGNVGGMQTPLRVKVPLLDEAGQPVLEEDGTPKLIGTDGIDKARSIGYAVAKHAANALREAERMEGAFFFDTLEVLIPFENMKFKMAMQTGLIAHYDDFIMDNPDFCGGFGCIKQTLHHFGIGKLHFISLPGELFPESSVGREASEHDYGSTHGVHQFAAIEGYRSYLPSGHFLIELGLANNELGYIVPESDFFPIGHPERYEETMCVAEGVEPIVREGIIELLQR